MRFDDVGVLVPKIYLPANDVDLNRWSVIACDQYLSQPEYWDDVTEYVGSNPSTFHMILPEAYLDDTNLDDKTKEVSNIMSDYLEHGFLEEQKEGFILLKRVDSLGKIRKGLIVALDLERYDFRPDSKELIRTTEGTYMDKVHPRVKIRQEAKLELPHILVLIDDPKNTVIEPLFDMDVEKIYDFNLMFNGGRLTGYMVSKEKEINHVIRNLRGLLNPKEFNERYGLKNEKPFLYAMGDGNHSFATAQAVWNKVKENAKDEDVSNHPARWALVELINVQDPGLGVEPIHRTITGVDKKDFFEKMEKFFTGKNIKFTNEPLISLDEVEKVLSEVKNSTSMNLTYIFEGKFGVVKLYDSVYDMEVEALEDFLEEYLENSDSKLSFIHGEDVVTKLGEDDGVIGFYSPKLSKDHIFKRILTRGPYHRKSISMGHANDKRYYMECRKITL